MLLTQQERHVLTTSSPHTWLVTMVETASHLSNADVCGTKRWLQSFRNCVTTLLALHARVVGVKSDMKAGQQHVMKTSNPHQQRQEPGLGVTQETF